MRGTSRCLRATVLAVAVGMVACGEVGPTSTHRFEVETVDGVEVATNRGGPRFAEPLFTLEEQLTLVQDPNNEASLLYRPSDFARGGDGNYYVADSGNRRIAVFDETGQFVRSFGREGGGPGEFVDAGEYGESLQLKGPFGSEIQVFDGNAQRTQRFAFDGTFIEAVSVPTEGRANSLLREPDGTLVFTHTVSDRDDDLVLDATAIAVIPAGADEPVANVTTAAMPTFVASMVQTEEYAAMVYLLIPFSGSPMAFRGDDQLVLVNGDVGQVEWRAVDGTLQRRALIERPPAPVTESMRKRFTDYFMAERARDDEEGRSFPAPMPDLWYPEVAGWWQGGHLDDAGYLWLRDAMQVTLREDNEAMRYELLSPAGEYLGAAFLPAGDLRVQGDTILVIDQDPATDEARLRVLRLQPSAPGFDFPQP